MCSTAIPHSPCIWRISPAASPRCWRASAAFRTRNFGAPRAIKRHGVKAKKDFDHYIRHNLVFDTAGFAGGIGAIKAGLCEIPASRIVFATDYPQEIRKREAVRDFVHELRALGADGERILSGNVGLLLKEPPAPERTKIEERML